MILKYRYATKSTILIIFTRRKTKVNVSIVYVILKSS